MSAPGGPPRAFRQDAGAVLPEIEVLRAIAILMVLVEHAPFNLVWWNGRIVDVINVVGRGWTGVDLFFVVSGFVIGRSLFPKLDDVRPRDAAIPVLRFWCRRAWRLLPSALLWLVLPVLAAVAFNRSGALHGVAANASLAVAAAVDLANIRLAETFGRGDAGLAFPYWSLSLEEQFYLLLPAAILLLRGRLPLLLALLVLTTLQFETPMSMMTRSGGLAIGLLLAIAERRLPELWRIAAPAALASPARAALLCTAIGFLLLLGSDKLSVVSIRLLPIDVISGVLVFLAAQDRGLICGAGAIRRGATWLGGRSYSLYLVHVPIYACAHETWFRLHGAGRPSGAAVPAFLAGACVACLAAAELNHRLVEEPLRRRGRRIAERIGAAPTRREAFVR